MSDWNDAINAALAVAEAEHRACLADVRVDMWAMDPMRLRASAVDRVASAIEALRRPEPTPAAQPTELRVGQVWRHPEAGKYTIQRIEPACFVVVALGLGGVITPTAADFLKTMTSCPGWTCEEPK